MTENKTQEILKTRADKLAKQSTENGSIKESLEAVFFQLANETYAIETRFVREVHILKDFTSLPCVPAFVFGLMNVRRQILSVIDLRVLFGLPFPQQAKEEKVIILEGEQMTFAIRTDGINGVEKIDIEDIQQQLPTLTGVRQDFLKGITAKGIVILDGIKLLTSQQLIVEEKMEI